MRGPAVTASILGLTLAGCGAGPSGAAEVSVADAVVTLPAARGRPGAGYFRLETDGDRTRLVGVDSARAGRVELHEPWMRPAGALIFSRGEPLLFAPGGRHAMLYELDPSLRPGARVALTFTFEGAPPVTVEAQVRAPGDVEAGH